MMVALLALLALLGAPARPTAPAPVQHAVVVVAPPSSTTTVSDASPTTSGCAAALAYLATHAAPGFTAYCPHAASGHQAATTYLNCTATACTDGVIYIADPCPAAYMNEANNSWVFTRAANPWVADRSAMDPYGACGS
jgi:hypothetical protein